MSPECTSLRTAGCGAEQDPDLRPTLSFSRLLHAPGATLVGDYGTWSAKRKEAAGGDDYLSDDGFDDFKAQFERISLVDLSKYNEWLSDVRGVLWGRYELLIYIFYAHGGAPQPSSSSKEKHGTITLLSVWEFVRACALTSPTFGINELDHIVPDHSLTRRKKVTTR